MDNMTMLSREFLKRHPLDAARILEVQPVDDVAVFLEDAPVAPAAQVLTMNIGVTGPKGTAMLVQEGSGFAVSLMANIEGREEERGPGEELATVMAAEQRHFLSNLESDEPISPGIREGLLAIEIHQAIERSWQTGERVSLSPTSE